MPRQPPFPAQPVLDIEPHSWTGKQVLDSGLVLGELNITSCIAKESHQVLWDLVHPQKVLQRLC